MDLITYIYLVIVFAVLYFTVFQFLVFLKHMKDVKKKIRF